MSDPQQEAEHALYHSRHLTTLLRTNDAELDQLNNQLDGDPEDPFRSDAYRVPRRQRRRLEQRRRQLIAIHDQLQLERDHWNATIDRALLARIRADR